MYYCKLTSVIFMYYKSGLRFTNRRKKPPDRNRFETARTGAAGDDIDLHRTTALEKSQTNLS